jgi:hypothetical protein
MTGSTDVVVLDEALPKAGVILRWMNGHVGQREGGLNSG